MFYSGLDSKVVAGYNSPVDVRIGHYRHLWPVASAAVHSHVDRLAEKFGICASLEAAGSYCVRLVEDGGIQKPIDCEKSSHKLTFDKIINIHNTKLYNYVDIKVSSLKFII